MLAMQRARVTQLRTDAGNGSLQAAAVARQRRLSALQEALAVGVKDEKDIQQLRAAKQALEADVREAERLRGNKQREMETNPQYGVLRQQTQLARAAARKVEDRKAKLVRMVAKRDERRAEWRRVGGGDGEEETEGGQEGGGAAGAAVTPTKSNVTAFALDHKAAQVRKWRNSVEWKGEGGRGSTVSVCVCVCVCVCVGRGQERGREEEKKEGRLLRRENK